jgi:hypothetical protein
MPRKKEYPNILSLVRDPLAHPQKRSNKNGESGEVGR